MIQVVAAVIEREGRVLIGQRTAGQAHALQWEFPGGKVEPGESAAEALARELEEELGIRNARGEEIQRYGYEYPGKSAIELIFFGVISFNGEIENRIYGEIRWEPRDRLASFDFLEGDRDFIARFSGDAGRVKPPA